MRKGVANFIERNHGLIALTNRVEGSDGARGRAAE